MFVVGRLGRYLVAVVLIGVSLGAPSATASSKPITHCGNWGWIDELEEMGWTYDEVQGAGIFDVKAVKTPCSVARRVALKASPENNYRGWKCRYRKRGYEYASIRCSRRSGKIVRWATGA